MTYEFLNKQAQLRLCKLGPGTLFKGALKLSIFVVQKAAAPKNGVEFRQSSNGSIRSSQATSCDVARGLWISTNQRPRNYLTQTHKLCH